jgi:hypothetical protein
MLGRRGNPLNHAGFRWGRALTQGRRPSPGVDLLPVFYGLLQQIRKQDVFVRFVEAESPRFV